MNVIGAESEIPVGTGGITERWVHLGPRLLWVNRLRESGASRRASECRVNVFRNSPLKLMVSSQ